jgi:hypothetical protein
MMHEEFEHAASRGRASVAMLWPIGSWLVGMFISFYPTFVSGFGFVQGGRGDSRLVNFSLEHSYRWLAGMPLAESLWSPPIFHPIQGVAAYTDLMFGVGFLYWPWRALGIEPLTSYQVWMICIWSLNFLACYLLLRHGVGLKAWGASAGAYLFAFANPRFMNFAHQQLAPQFFLIVSLAGLVALFNRRQGRNATLRRWIASIALWCGLLLQFYTAVYLFLFFLIGLAAAAAVALAMASLRRDFLTEVKKALIPLVVTGLVALVLAAPLAARYQASAATLGVRTKHQVHLPKALSWVLPGHTNRIYGSLQKALPLDQYRGFSQTNGIGLITTAACLAGLWLGRRRPVVVLVFLAMAGLVLLTASLPGGWSPWWLVRKFVPGAAALRAVARIGLMALYPAAIGLAITIDHLAGRRKWLIACALALCVLAEQTQRKRGFDKLDATARVEQIAAEIPANATSFLLVIDGRRWDRHVHDDAAWAALATGVPTINGRYGNFPPEYPFKTPWVQERSGSTGLRAALDSWVADHGLVAEDTALVPVRARPRRGR